MAPSALTEVKDLTAAVGDRVLSVFGQIQFHDVILQRCRDGLRRTLAGAEPDERGRPAAILETARARYVTQVRPRIDAQAIGADAHGPSAPDIAIF